MLRGRVPRRPKAIEQRAVSTCFSDYPQPTETVLIWISEPLISEEATVIGGEDIGTLQSDSALPFIKSNGFKTSPAWTQTPINSPCSWNRLLAMLLGLHGQLLTHLCLYTTLGL